MSFISCSKSAADDAATLASANAYTDAQLAAGVPPSGSAGGDLSGTYPNPTLKTASVVDAVEAGIAADTGAQAAIAAAIADELVASGAFQTALAAAAPNLKTCSGDAMAAGANVPTCSEMNAAIAAGVSGGAAGDATTTTKGIVELATNTETQAGTSTTLAVTPAGVAAAITSAVAALPGDKFLQGLQSYNAATNTMVLSMSDGTTVSIDMTALLNDAVASVTATPDASETVKGIVELATTAEAAAGTSTTLAVTPAGLTAAISGAATPDATDTVKGKVSLATAANMPSTSDEEAATPAAVNAAIAANNTAMGASAAETIAGIEAAKFVSPDDMKAALESGVVYPISVVQDGTKSVPSGILGAGAHAAIAGINTNATGPFAIGVWGESTSAASGNAAGVRGWVTGGTQPVGAFMIIGAEGVITSAVTTPSGSVSKGSAGANQAVGAGTKAGVHGTSEGPGGVNYGVYGVATNGTTNWAGFFAGNVNATGTVTQGSDSRIKRDVKTIDAAKALAFRNGLRWVTFEKFFTVQDNEGNDVELVTGYEAGLIAQEVQALTKKIGAFEFVVKDSNPDMLGLDYNSINAIVMAAEQAVLVK